MYEDTLQDKLMVQVFLCKAVWVFINCVSHSLLDCTRNFNSYQDPKWWMGIARILRTSWRVSTMLLSLLSIPSESRTRTCLFHFLKCSLPSLHSLSMFFLLLWSSFSLPFRHSRWRLTERIARPRACGWQFASRSRSDWHVEGFGSAPNYRNRMLVFPADLFFFVNRDNVERKAEETGNCSLFFAKEK